MANIGKVKRVIRELVAVLVGELGPETAACMLEDAAAQVRGAGHKPAPSTTQQEGRVGPGRKTAQVIELKR